MKNIFEAAVLAELKQRIAQLRPDSQRLWGKMTPAQALAHCTAAMKMTNGEMVVPRIFLGRLLGPLAKKSLLVKGEPMRRNAMTPASTTITGERDFELERQRLTDALDRFVAGGPAACTKQAHFFFGPLTPAEWAVLVYQHLDHHLRQFGV